MGSAPPGLTPDAGSSTKRPAGSAGEGATGHAEAYSATKEGFRPPQRVAFRPPRFRRFASRCKLRPPVGVDPVGQDPMQARAAMCLSAVSGSAPLLTLRRKRSQRASWISGHLALLPGAGRLHVDVGWAHPRPVAANDVISVAGPQQEGDKVEGADRGQTPPTAVHPLGIGPCGASLRPGRLSGGPPRAAAVKDGRHFGARPQGSSQI
jgi:hypothetical protein